MALVAYSDSEDSEAEETPNPVQHDVPKPTFQRTEPRKIKVDLPSAQAVPVALDEQPPAKRPRTDGAFGGFNSFLPAPKRAAQSGPRAGVSLKTSSEAAFSREGPSTAAIEREDSKFREIGEVVKDHPSLEVKLVGKATRFKPLSVANRKTKKRVVAKEAAGEGPVLVGEAKLVQTPPAGSCLALVKEKRSLFSVQQDDGDLSTVPAAASQDYESITIENLDPASKPDTNTANAPAPGPSPVPANALEAVASDLNLTPAQRRHLFGRNSKNTSANINVSHFDLDSEYAHNEQLRQNGEAFEHKAVKSIAPGKHSLQQLVNNARSNQDSIEDKWATDRAKRGAGPGGR